MVLESETAPFGVDLINPSERETRNNNLPPQFSTSSHSHKATSYNKGEVGGWSKDNNKHAK